MEYVFQRGSNTSHPHALLAPCYAHIAKWGLTPLQLTPGMLIPHL